MKLDKLKDDRKLEICRKYFYAGLALLPFVWLINIIWFFKHAFIRKPYPEQLGIRKFVIQSLIGLIIWTIILITWNVIFQKYRVDWDDIGDQLTFVIPRGKP